MPGLSMFLVYLRGGLNHVLGIVRKPCDRLTPTENGRTGEIRTRDQRIKSPLLYRLSYRPIFMALQNNDPRFYWIAC
jgi:hypothetical protein